MLDLDRFKGHEEYLYIKRNDLQKFCDEMVVYASPLNIYNSTNRLINLAEQCKFKKQTESLLAEVEALRAELGECRELIKRTQHAGFDDDPMIGGGIRKNVCPECGCSKYHGPLCPVQERLAAIDKLLGVG